MKELSMTLLVITTIAVLIFIGCSKEPDFRSERGLLPTQRRSNHMHIPGLNLPTIADMAKLREEVGFDEETGKKIMEIIHKYDALMKQSLIKIQREELNVREELLKEKPDLNYIQSCIERKTGVFAAIEMEQIKRDLSTKDLLTSEQYERWMEAVSQRIRDNIPGVFERKMPMMPPGDGGEGPAGMK